MILHIRLPSFSSKSLVTSSNSIPKELIFQYFLTGIDALLGLKTISGSSAGAYKRCIFLFFYRKDSCCHDMISLDPYRFFNLNGNASCCENCLILVIGTYSLIFNNDALLNL